MEIIGPQSAHISLGILYHALSRYLITSYSFTNSVFVTSSYTTLSGGENDLGGSLVWCSGALSFLDGMLVDRRIVSSSCQV